MARRNNSGRQVDNFSHEDAARRNIPTAEYESLLEDEDRSPVMVAYERRNRDLDPQLVWRGKDDAAWSDLVVQAPPLFIQEKVHPKVLIDDLQRMSEVEDRKTAAQPDMFDLFADFNGLPSEAAKTEFYQHDQNWSNRMILGDSLHVMASLAEREGLRGQVQCIYIDPPYGIKFNSNFQWSTTSRDVKDGNQEHITREPEQVKAFRDTWRDGIHSYLTYLRDRLTVARDLLTESGSVFVQIGDENAHLIKCLFDEIYGSENFISLIAFTKTTGLGATHKLAGRFDFIIWYSKNAHKMKYRQLFTNQDDYESSGYNKIDDVFKNSGPYMSSDLTKPGPGQKYDVNMFGRVFTSGKRWWGYPPESINRLYRAGRIEETKSLIRFKKFYYDYPMTALNNLWLGLGGAKLPQYVVETNESVVSNCILMSTDTGDLVLDPTCGSGTTAYVAEQWGRRWITIDTSRVALALARSRIMGARYPYYLLADSPEGQQKEAEISRTETSMTTTYENIRHGFVYERVPRIMLKDIANNAEIDVIWEKYQEELEPLRQKLNDEVGRKLEEWEIPREPEDGWSFESKNLHEQWWKLRIERQKEIDASIAAKADNEYLYDKPYEDNRKVRVAGPFTVESLSPHRSLHVGPHGELIDPLDAHARDSDSDSDFIKLILDNLRTAGVQQVHREDRIDFISLKGWPGDLICAEGIYLEGEQEKRAGILIGPEFGTVSRQNLVEAAREAGDAGFDVLIACAFAYDSHAQEINRLGRVSVLRARMNADLHMAEDLRNNGKGNLFVIFGEPDIDITSADDGQYRVKINGVDVFDPNTGEIRSDSADGIACWFIDTDYNSESFFVRHAYFLGANDPYKALKTTLRAEINEEAWETLHSDISRPFDRPRSGKIAVKVINHLGDEVMKVFRVE